MRGPPSVDISSEYSFTNAEVNGIPEPATVSLVAFGLVEPAARRRSTSSSGGPVTLAGPQS